MGFNSPIPVRLQEETRKAAKIMSSFADSHNNGVDKVVPQAVLERAAGFAIFTVIKAGFVLTARGGSGVVIARLPDGGWSAPSAIGLGGFGFGGQMGAEVTDFLVVLNSSAAVKSFMAAGSLTLGGNLSVAVGPLGRNAEGTGALNTKGKMAAMYSYSKTKGLFGGISVEGSVILERQDANRLAYGGSPSAKQILSGAFDPPDWAHVLIDAIERCTGLPGGQRWRSWDEEGEGGGMGYASPGQGERGGSGYVFGEGVGAGGAGGRSRGGSGTGSFVGEGRKRGASLGMFDRAAHVPGVAGGGSPPVRPSPTKRTSSFNPFSSSNGNSGSGSGSPGGKRGQQPPGMSSSENYNAGLTWDSDGPSTPWATRPRAGSSGLRPAHLDEGRARSNSDPRARRGRVDDLLGDDDAFGHSNGSKPREGQRSRSSTLGEANGDDGFGLGRMTLGDGYSNGSGRNSRSRANSRLTDDGGAYTPHETISTFAHTGSLRSKPDDVDPFGEGSVTGAFSQYRPASPHSSRGAGSGSGSGSGAGARRPQHGRSGSALRTALTPSGSDQDLRRGGAGDLGPSETGYARAVALFDLPASADGDLPLRKGQVVFAMDRVGAGEWWRGMDLEGRAGIFPANYVEVLEIPRGLKGGLSKSDLKKRVLDLDLEF